MPAGCLRFGTINNRNITHSRNMSCSILRLINGMFKSLLLSTRKKKKSHPERGLFWSCSDQPVFTLKEFCLVRLVGGGRGHDEICTVVFTVVTQPHTSADNAIY